MNPPERAPRGRRSSPARQAGATSTWRSSEHSDRGIVEGTRRPVRRGIPAHPINRLLDAVAVLVTLAVGEEAVLTHDQAPALLQVKKPAAEAREATERSEARRVSGPLRPSVLKPAGGRPGPSRRG